VHVEHSTTEVEELMKTLGEYTIVVQTEQLPVEVENRLNAACRDKKVKYLMSYTKGLAARLFVDLGPEFTVVDKDGEEVQEKMIKSIGQEEKCVIELSENNK
jgi:sialic acid synthase SpsE